ncbi:hypothetical protein M011DRAFT_478720 [Sporormia fimetaria CBS 119925]|uniref:Large ribosomal subunit protein uL30m n=1 Tax=Sporormia fimetaria CBS 119925 TaxID=1340428 RepID=A0A6A6V7U4_9PLEO|nr:hypothetical protein M011DRAFT_478720 [Sporormia fimetaria CBS 119925]
MTTHESSWSNGRLSQVHINRTAVHTPGYRTPSTPTMAYFRITLMRSGIGMPAKIQGVLHALGLKKRMTTVYHPVTPSVAGQIMRIKELVDVKEVDKALTKKEIHAARRPDPGYYIERKAGAWNNLEQ